jgi:hypothetical protein
MRRERLWGFEPVKKRGFNAEFAEEERRVRREE